MTATVWVPFDKFKKAQLDGSLTGTPSNLSSDTLRIMVLTSSYTPSKSGDDYRSTIVANEVTGTNYTARGFLAATKTFALLSGVVTFGCADIAVAQSGAGFATGQIMVIYKDSGVDATSPLIAYNSTGANFGNTVGALSILLATNGILAFN